MRSLRLACSAFLLGTTWSARFQINGFCFDFGAAGFSCVVCCCSDEINGAMVVVLHQNTTTFSGWVGQWDALPVLLKSFSNFLISRIGEVLRFLMLRSEALFKEFKTSQFLRPDWGVFNGWGCCHVPNPSEYACKKEKPVRDVLIHYYVHSYIIKLNVCLKPGWQGLHLCCVWLLIIMIIYYTSSLKGRLSPSMTKPPIGLLLRFAS